MVGRATSDRTGRSGDESERWHAWSRSRRCSRRARGCRLRREGGARRRGDAEQFTLALDFYVNPDHAGIYAALERGDFDEAGLDVEPQVPSDPSAPIRQVAAGRADLAISYEPEVLLARDQGLPVMAVARSSRSR